LLDMRLEIERAIDSDFGFVCFAERRKESEEHREAMILAKAELVTLKAEIASLVQDKRRLEITPDQPTETATHAFTGGRQDVSLREGKIFDTERLAMSPLFNRRLF